MCSFFFKLVRYSNSFIKVTVVVCLVVLSLVVYPITKFQLHTASRLLEKSSSLSENTLFLTNEGHTGKKS